MNTVLDSYALLAFFRGEASASVVQDVLHRAAETGRPVHMTEVNYAEVKYMLLKKEGAAAWGAAADVLVSLPISFHPIDRALADEAAEVKARHKLSLADACAVALAKAKKAELLTGDPEFKAVAKEIKVRWMGA